MLILRRRLGATSAEARREHVRVSLFGNRARAGAFLGADGARSEPRTELLAAQASAGRPRVRPSALGARRGCVERSSNRKRDAHALGQNTAGPQERAGKPRTALRGGTRRTMGASGTAGRRTGEITMGMRVMARSAVLARRWTCRTVAVVPAVRLRMIRGAMRTCCAMVTVPARQTHASPTLPRRRGNPTDR